LFVFGPDRRPRRLSGRLWVGVHDEGKYDAAGDRVGPMGPVTSPSHHGAVVKAVIFDFYGTLAHWEDQQAAGYEHVFSAFGYAPDPAVFGAYVARYDGVEHADHSVSQDAYEAWVRWRLQDLARSCGVRERHLDDVVDALRAADQNEMVAYPEALTTMTALHRAGIAVGVCSNWGWELDAYLHQVGLLHLCASRVTSARAGARKPHPTIYAASVGALGVEPHEVLFVGDSWEPDVRGPRRLGMTAVHVWRAEERHGQVAPALQPGDHRVAELGGVLELVGL
jgi:putative hydrolase of the HAD superfamily